MSEELCHWCKSKAWKTINYAAGIPYCYYDCGSNSEQQSDKCRIKQLEQENASLHTQVTGLSKGRADLMRVELHMDSGHIPESITCEQCPQNGACVFAWDAYNTNGDCLAEK